MKINFIQTQLRYVLYIAFFLGTGSYSAQEYFQQEVNYTISVKLNDTLHTLSATEEIFYKNNSPQTLDVIYFHLWPNAYKNNSTALAKQLLNNNKTELYFSEENDRGYIDSLDFKVNGQAVKLEYDSKHIDICKLILNQPLPAGQSLTITTPFFVKLPDAKFSRLGHTAQAYFITQWYPKPAVYDKTGWHTMPYLDQGEFYSEYGSFDVSITLPDNYVLAATGNRIGAKAEDDFLDQRILYTLKVAENKREEERGLDFPKSSKEIKTIRFVQNYVHDFAWFADKRFFVMKDKVELPISKREVDTWVFFTGKYFDQWFKATNYVGDAIRFYSKHNGEYPYKHATAVDGTIMAGGGMEYPNITVIGDAETDFDLDMVITHEVGHNWFYGILGNNERDHPFLDEGINSVNELRYVRKKYGDEKLTMFIDKDSTFRLFRLNKAPIWKYHELSYFSPLRKHTDQPLNLTSTLYTEENYGAVVYSKSAMILDFLLDYLGEEKFDKAMHDYFEAYKFKHPDPSDFFKIMSTSSGKDLTWFENYLYSDTKAIDYKISSVKKKKNGSYDVKIKNKTMVPLPFNIYAFNNNTVIDTTWFLPIAKKGTVNIPAGDYDRFTIDGGKRMPDLRRKNNSSRTSGILKKAEPLQLTFLSALEDPSKTQLHYFPVIGVNRSNGFMAGLALHNYNIYQKRFEFLVSPMYAFNTKDVAGYGEFNFNCYPKGIFTHITAGVKAKSFSYNSYAMFDRHAVAEQHYLKYLRVSPYIEFELNKKDKTDSKSQFITYTSNNLFTDSIVPNDFILPLEVKNRMSVVNQLSYKFSNGRAINSYNFNLNLQHTATMAKVFGTMHFKINTGKTHFIDLRVFAGTFIAGSVAERSYYAFRASGYDGWNDYLFEGNYFSRERMDGPLQFTERDGALKTWTPLGQTPEWLTSVNLKSPKIFSLPFKIFADVVVCDQRSLYKDKFLWDAGVNLVIWRDMIDIYFPLVYNTDIGNTFNLNRGSNYIQKIRFTFNIHKLDPKKILQTSLF